MTVRSVNNRRQHYQETSLLCTMVEMQVMSKKFEEMVSNFQFVIVKLAYIHLSDTKSLLVCQKKLIVLEASIAAISNPCCTPCGKCWSCYRMQRIDIVLFGLRHACSSVRQCCNVKTVRVCSLPLESVCHA